MGFLNSTDLQAIGFRCLGENVQISDAAKIYGSEQISIGSNVRIDDFCILSAGVGGIEVGDHVHIACYSSLIGQGLIRLEDFCGLSARVSIYSSTDDYSGSALTNPTVPRSLRNVKSGPVVLRKHVIVGVGCLILPQTQSAPQSPPDQKVLYAP